MKCKPSLEVALKAMKPLKAFKMGVGDAGLECEVVLE